MTTPFGEGRANLEGQARIYHRELGRSVLALHLLDEVSQVKVDRVVESALYLGMP